MGIIFIGFILCFVPMIAKSYEIVDLTYPFNAETIYWPTAKGFELKKIFSGMTEGGYFYSGNTFCAPEHGGTHLDAPIHFSRRGKTVDQLSLEQLAGPVIVLDLRDKVGNNSDYLIPPQDIKEWEKNHQKITNENIVLFLTGWGRFWGDKKRYLGTDIFGDVQNLHFPGLSEEASRYLAKKNIKGVGIDTPSLDRGASKDFMAHRILLGKNIYGLENVAHIEKLPFVGATLYVAPMKIEKGTGAPARVFAVVP